MKFFNFFSKNYEKMTKKTRAFINKTERFIKGRIYIIRDRYITLNEKYNINNIIKEFLINTFNILGSGFLIYYAITHKNFVAYGVSAAMIKYYISWLIDKIKEKNEQ